MGPTLLKNNMNTQPNGIHLIDAEAELLTAADGSRAIKRTQEITTQFLDNLAQERIASKTAKAGEFHKVASIPTAVVEKWMKEGFNIFDKNVNLKEILRRLNSEDMQKFLATEKRVT